VIKLKLCSDKTGILLSAVQRDYQYVGQCYILGTVFLRMVWEWDDHHCRAFTG